MSWLRTRLPPPLIASVALFVHAGLMYKAALRHTAGNVSYPIDDAFIHLALAKQIATHGIYGVTPHEFTAASSSIGWPLLLALGIKVVGAAPWLPLLFNGLIAIALFFGVDRAVRTIAPEATLATRTVILLLVMALTPMATLVVLGMEHTAHAAATVVFVAVATSWLVRDSNESRTLFRSAVPVALWAGATTLWRYEGMFPVALVVGLALLRRRVRSAVLIAALGALPIVLFGLYSIAHGAHFLPTPVLIKGRHFDLGSAASYWALFGGDLIERFSTEAYALSIAAAAAALVFSRIKRDGFWSAPVVALLLVLGTLLIHLELASVGWFYRYESYLIVIGITFVTATVARNLPPRAELQTHVKAQPIRSAAALVGALILLAPLARRAIQANGSTPLACRNIYDQQMQSARFLASSFPHERVAVNDIGAVAWMGSDHVVDLVGLATLPVAEAKGLELDKALSPADLVRLTQGVKVAILYDEWFHDNLPATWLRVGRWRIDDNKSCAFPTVAIYATDPESYVEVIERLRAFAPSLPATVTSEGRFSDFPGAAGRLRAGDRVVIATSVAQTSGSYVVQPDGNVWLRGYGPAAVRDLTEAEAAAAIQKQVALGPRLFGDLAVESVTRVTPREPLIYVGGHVGSSGEVRIASLTIDAAIAAAGNVASAHPSAAWVWRETPTGFVKIPRAELAGGALVDGDIVVVP